MRHEMPIPRWFQREVQLINENYFCIFNPRKQEYQVRAWLRKFWRPTNLIDCFKNSKIVHTIPYHLLDERGLYSLRVGLYNARVVKRLLHELDEANRRMVEKADAEDDYQNRAAAKDIWRHYQEPRVFVEKKADVTNAS